MQRVFFKLTHKSYLMCNYISIKILALKFSTIYIMHKINPKCSDEESFMYSTIISLHYYDISNNLERISTLRPYIKNYDFTDITPQKFEVNNPDISLTVIDDDKIFLYISRNKSRIRPKIVKLENNRYATIKPVKNKYIKLKEILRLFSHKEISDIIKQKIIQWNIFF